MRHESPNQTDSDSDPNSDPNSDIDTGYHLSTHTLLLLIFLGILLLTYLFSLKSNYFGAGEIRISQTKYGHYVAKGTINGHKVLYLVDTGATFVSIPEPIAKKIGLVKGQSYKSNTANGTALSYATNLKTLTVGSLVFKNVRASINPGFKSNKILLGMVVLRNLDIEQSNNELILRQK